MWSDIRSYREVSGLQLRKRSRPKGRTYTAPEQFTGGVDPANSSYCRADDSLVHKALLVGDGGY
jgi:hypothetical protein